MNAWARTATGTDQIPLRFCVAALTTEALSLLSLGDEASDPIDTRFVELSKAMPRI